MRITEYKIVLLYGAVCSYETHDDSWYELKDVDKYVRVSRDYYCDAIRIKHDQCERNHLKNRLCFC